MTEDNQLTEQTRPSELAEFDQQWLAVLEQTPFAKLILGFAGLTRLGERPAALDHLAALVDRPIDETAALVREATSAHIESHLIHWDEAFPGDRTRRMLHVGDRDIPMRSGCAPDLFAFAAVLDVPFRVEEPCAATGTPIRIDFVPNGYRRVDPPQAVTVLMPAGRLRDAANGPFEQVDTDVCAHQPLFVSAEAAEPALAARPGSRAFTVKEMFERPWVTYYRDHLRPLIHD